jgi:hypothetical protein
MEAPKGLRGNDTTLHKDATAGSLGLINDKAITIKTMTNSNLPTNVPDG